MAAVIGVRVDEGTGSVAYEYPPRTSNASATGTSTPAPNIAWVLQRRGIMSCNELLPRKPLICELLPLVRLTGSCWNELLQSIHSPCRLSRACFHPCHEIPPVNAWGNFVSTCAL